jgi:hypothetical protein
MFRAEVISKPRISQIRSPRAPVTDQYSTTRFIDLACFTPLPTCQAVGRMPFRVDPETQVLAFDRLGKSARGSDVSRERGMNSSRESAATKFMTICLLQIRTFHVLLKIAAPSAADTAFPRRRIKTNSCCAEVKTMNSETTKQVFSSHPRDKSLDAFKTWIIDIARRLTTEKSTIEFTEAEWTAFWRDFWREKYQS